jgi:hypothetical protein
MRASIAVTLLSVTLAIPALAEAAEPLVNIQQPAVSKAAAQQPRKISRRAAARTPATRPATVRQAAAPQPAPPAQPAAQQASSSVWSYSLLSWLRSDPPAPAAPAANPTLLAAQAEPAAAEVEVAAAQTTGQAAPATKPVRKKARRTTKKTAAIAAASPAEKVEVTKEEKPKSKRRAARRNKPREERVASRQTPPTPRAKPVTSDASSPEQSDVKTPGQSDVKTPEQSDVKTPEQSDDTTVGSIEPAPAQQAEQQTASLGDDIKNGEATWWQNQGNPVVFNFRDCVASFASREAGRNKSSTWADLLIQATESDCRAPFDEMARTLAQRFGESGIEPVMRELIDTTFLPAAKSAAANAPPPAMEAPSLPDIPDIPTQ